jgi:hypothetical protein
MPLEARLKAAEDFWVDEQSADQQIEAVGAIASQMKFRPKSVISLPIDRKAKYLASLPTISDTVAARALVNYHLTHKRGMMGDFLTALGIAHEEGLINEENVEKPDAEKIRSAATELGKKYQPDEVTLYFSTLVSQDPETWAELAEITETTAP